MGCGGHVGHVPSREGAWRLGGGMVGGGGEGQVRGAARRTRRVTAAALALALVTTACPREVRRAPEPDPAAAVVVYRDALLGNDPDLAFAMIHPDAREGLDADAFRSLFARHRDALIEQAERLVAIARSAPPREEALVETSTGPVRLVRTPEGWRLTVPVGVRAEE